jgi:hypothetical protein
MPSSAHQIPAECQAVASDSPAVGNHAGGLLASVFAEYKWQTMCTRPPAQGQLCLRPRMHSAGCEPAGRRSGRPSRHD